MSLIDELEAQDKKGLFKSNDNIVCYPTGITVLDYANGYWSEVMNEDGELVRVPNIGIPAGSMVSIIGSTGNGKAIPDDTILKTPRGDKFASDIQVGDELYTVGGKVTKVTGVYPQGRKKCYKIIFQDGRTAKCSEDHLWNIKFNDYEEFKTLSIHDIINESSRHGYPFVVNPISKRGVLILQYACGIPAFMPRSIEKMYGPREETSFEEKIDGLTVDQRKSALKSLIGETHFHELFDDDDSVKVTTVYDFECKDFNTTVNLARSLGFLAETASEIKFRDGNWNRVKGISIRFNEEGILRIWSIEDLGYKVPMRCFMVEDESHLFMTENYILTHNTTFALQAGWNIVKDFENGLLMDVDCEKGTERERVTNILGCARDEPRLVINKAKSSIDDILESFDLLCETKRAGGKKYMYEVHNRSYDGKPFWMYVPSVFVIDSLPKFNCRDFNDKDLGGNIDAMRGAKDVTRFYTNVIDRAWEFNVIFIVINHIRSNTQINPYQTPPRGLMMINPMTETLPRGSVAQYYSSVYFRINSKKSECYTYDNEGFTGFKCEIQLAKSRTNVIGSQFPVAFLSDRGFDPIYSMYEFAHSMGLIQGKNPYLYIKGFDERKFNRKEFISLMTVDEHFRNGVLSVLKPFYEDLLSSKREKVAEMKSKPDLSLDQEALSGMHEEPTEEDIILNDILESKRLTDEDVESETE